MDKIVECVPNFSDGVNHEVHEAIGRAISSVENVKLLDIDPDASYNRVVVTFVGEPDAVVEAALRATEVAVEMIDMTKHKGEHPRFGALDVCPFVPIRGVTMADCAKLANIYGEKAAQKFGIPVYLYEQAAIKPERKNLATVRAGEYEGLEKKLADPEWIPDYGPAKFVPRFGAVATGARFFLVAYNVNVATSDVSVTNDIALTIRQMGKPRMKNGVPVLNSAGKKIFDPGKLRMVKAMGVPLENDPRTQISMNLNNYLITPPHVAFEEAKFEAAKHGVEITGSEIVGLVPIEPLLMAAHWHLFNIGEDGRKMTDEELVSIAQKYLGLSDYKPFDRNKKIIEFAIRQ
ncbi:glutamate formimidoyltransferase [Myxococcota bacterium]|nr:glutamate formimidoyltransferase [Myxococcota bacterium]MBU1381896.1 glutamate formimidoyltransferase [Myxococcota bacterium]MBU1497797.1 glutamate formimidoyltransferase [Myxococcota bacterium]